MRNNNPDEQGIGDTSLWIQQFQGEDSGIPSYENIKFEEESKFIPQPPPQGVLSIGPKTFIPSNPSELENKQVPESEVTIQSESGPTTIPFKPVGVDDIVKGRYKRDLKNFILNNIDKVAGPTDITAGNLGVVGQASVPTDDFLSVFSQSLSGADEETQREMSGFMQGIVSQAGNIRSLTDKVNNNPDDIKSRSELGSLYATLGLNDEARNLLTYSAAKGDAAAMYGLAFLEANDSARYASMPIDKANEEREILVRSYLDDAIKADPKMTQPRIFKASLDIQDGNYKGAEGQIAQVILNQPTNSAAYEMMADLKKKTGDDNAAKFYGSLASVFSVIPDDPYFFDQDLITGKPVKTDYQLEREAQSKYMSSIADAIEMKGVANENLSMSEKLLAFAVNPFAVSLQSTFQTGEHTAHSIRNLAEHLPAALHKSMGGGVPYFNQDGVGDAWLKVAADAAHTYFGMYMLKAPTQDMMWKAMPEPVQKVFFEPITTGLSVSGDLSKLFEGDDAAAGDLAKRFGEWAHGVEKDYMANPDDHPLVGFLNTAASVALMGAMHKNGPDLMALPGQMKISRYLKMPEIQKVVSELTIGEVQDYQRLAKSKPSGISQSKWMKILPSLIEMEIMKKASDGAPEAMKAVYKQRMKDHQSFVENVLGMSEAVAEKQSSPGREAVMTKAGPKDAAEMMVGEKRAAAEKELQSSREAVTKKLISGEELSPAEVESFEKARNQMAPVRANERRAMRRRKFNLGSDRTKFLSEAKRAIEKVSGRKVIDDLDLFIEAANQELPKKFGGDKASFDTIRKQFVITKDGQEVARVNLGQVNGFNRSGVSFINPEAAKADTPVHEILAHPAVDKMLEDAGMTADQIIEADPSALNDAGKKLREAFDFIEGTEYFNELSFNDAYKNDTKGNRLYEALVTAVGEEGQKLVTPDMKQKITNFGNKIMSSLGLTMDSKIGEITKNIISSGLSEESMAFSVDPKKGDLIAGTYYEPHLTETKDRKNYVFFHFSPAERREIMKGIDSTKFYNTHTAKDEKSLQYGIASYYTMPRDSEGVIRGEKYAVIVPKNKVYPMDSDPNGYKIIAEKKYKEGYPYRAEWVKKEMVELAKRDGYEMAVGEWNYDVISGKGTHSEGEGLAMRGDAIKKLKPVLWDDIAGNLYTGKKSKAHHPKRDLALSVDKMTDFYKRVRDFYLSKNKYSEPYSFFEGLQTDWAIPKLSDFDEIIPMLPKKFQDEAKSLRKIVKRHEFKSLHGAPSRFSLLHKEDGYYDSKFSVDPSNPSEITLPNGKKENVIAADPELTNGFYSPLEKSIRNAKNSKWGSGAQALAELKKAGGLKQDELKWTGFEDWIKKQGSVTKEDMLEYVKKNRVELLEVVKKEYSDGGLNDEWTPGVDANGDKVWKNNGWKVVELSKGKDYAIVRPDGTELDGEWATRDGAIERVKIEVPNGTTKYSDYQLAGEKNNYREILVTLPKSDIEFKSTHWDEPNIIGHLRVSDRIDSEGNKVFHISELQSDWGQGVRTKGLDANKLPDTLKIELDKDVNDEPIYKIIDKRTGELKSRITNVKSEESAIHRYREVNDIDPVPNAPFINNTLSWTKLLLKYALREAVKSAATKISWETGDNQAERYSIGRELKRVSWIKEGGISGGPERYTIELNAKDGSFHRMASIDANKIQKVLGKDISNKITSHKENNGELNTDGIRIGSDGMVSFYGSPIRGEDGIVGKIARDLVKELTGKEGKIGETKIDNQNVGTVLSNKNGAYIHFKGDSVRDSNGNVMYFKSFGEAESYRKKIAQNTVQHSIEITPDLRSRVEDGLPQFSIDPNKKYFSEPSEEALFEIDRVKNAKEEDGATFNLDGSSYSGDVISVPILSKNIKQEELSDQAIRDFVAEKSGAIVDPDMVKPGIYRFPDRPEVSIDLNVIVDRSKKDIAVEFARKAGQESVYDMGQGVSIKTGETGESPVKFTDQQFKEIQKSLKEGTVPDVFDGKFSIEPGSETPRRITISEIQREWSEIKSPKGRAVKNVINLSAGVKLTDEQVSERKALKDQIKKEAYEAGRSGFLDYLGRLKSDGTLKGVIPAKVLLKFTKAVMKIKDDDSYRAAVETLSKIIEDKEYAESISAIQSLKESVASRMKGDKATYGDHTDSVKQLISIDEYSLSDLNSYHEMLSALDSKVPDIKKASELSEIVMRDASEANDWGQQNDLSEFIRGEIGKLAALPSEQERARGVKELFDSLTDKVLGMKEGDDGILRPTKIESIEDYRARSRAMSTISRVLRQASGLDPQSHEDLVRRIEEAQENFDSNDVLGDFKAEVERFKKQIAVEARGYFDVTDLSGLEPEFRDSVSRIFRAGDDVLSKLGVNDLENLRKAAYQLESGFFSPELFKISARVESVKRGSEIAKMLDETYSDRRVARLISKSKPEEIKDILRTGQKSEADVAVLAGKRSPYARFVKGFIERAWTSNESDTRKATKRYWDVAKKMKEDDRSVVGMILSQLDYQYNRPDFADLPAGEKDLYGYLLSQQRRNSAMPIQEVERIYKLAKPYLDEIVHSGADGLMLSGNKKLLYDIIREINQDLYKKNRVAALRRGKIIGTEEMYFKRVDRSEASSRTRFQADLESITDVINAMTSGYTLTSSATKARSSNGLYWREYNPDMVMLKAIREANRDYHLSDEVGVSLNALKYSESNASSQEAKDVSSYLHTMTFEGLRTELSNYASIHQSGGVLGGFWGSMSGTASTIVLADPVSRAIKEVTSNMSKWLLSRGLKPEISAKDYFNAIAFRRSESIQKLIDQLQVPILLNSQRYSVDVGRTGKEGKLKSISQAAGSMFDAWNKRAAFEAEFPAAFKKVSGKEFDDQAFLSDPEYATKNYDQIQEAVNIANMEVERITGPGSSFGSAEVASLFGAGRESGMFKLMAWMQHYNMIESRSLSNNMFDLIYNTNNGRTSAALNLAGLLASQVSYQMTSMIARSFYTGFGVKTYNDLSDEKKKQIDRLFSIEGFRDNLATSGINLTVGKYGNTMKIAVGLLGGFFDNYVKKAGDKELKEKWDQARNSAFDYFYVKPINFGEGFGATTAMDLIDILPIVPVVVSPLLEFLSGKPYLVDDVITKVMSGQDLTNDEEVAAYQAMVVINNFLPAVTQSVFKKDMLYPIQGTVYKWLREQKRESAKENKEQKKAAKGVKIRARRSPKKSSSDPAEPGFDTGAMEPSSSE